MTQSDLDEVKATIRGVLNSTPGNLSINELYKDYKDFNGVEIPFKNFGYHFLIDFLKSIPDTVTLQNPNSYESVVSVVHDSNTAHISKLVNSQKKSSTGAKRNGRRKQYCEGSNQITYAFRKEIWHHLNSFQSGMPRSHFKKVVNDLLYKYDIDRTVDYVLHNISDFTHEKGNKLFLNPNARRSDKAVDRNNSSSYLKNLEIASMSEIESENGSCGYYSSGEETRSTSSKFDSDELPEDNPLINQTLINNLHALLDEEENKNGIWIGDLTHKYLEKFGYDLSPNRYGFTDVTELAANLSNVFRLRQFRFEGKILLTDARNEECREKESQGEISMSLINDLKKMFNRKNRMSIYTHDLAQEYKRLYQKTLQPEEFGFKCMDSFLKNLQDFHSTDFCFRTIKQKVIMSLNHVPVKESNSKSINEDDTLKSVSFSPFPAEVCRDDFKLESDPFFNKIEKGQKFLVKIGEVYTPGRFYLHLKGNMSKLEAMMEDLNSFYELNEKEYEVLSTVITKGLLCTCQYSGDQRWHRVTIMQKDFTTAKANFIDYGTVELVGMEKLRYLHKDFAELPPLSFRAKLAGIKPKQGSDKLNKYSEICNHTFHDYANSSSLEAEIVNFDTRSNCMEVHLYHITDDNIRIPIHEKLIENGLADKKEIVSFADSAVSSLQVESGKSEMNTNSDIAKTKYLPPSSIEKLPLPSENLNFSKGALQPEFVLRNASKFNGVPPVPVFQPSQPILGRQLPPGLTLPPSFSQSEPKFFASPFTSNSNFLGYPLMSQRPMIDPMSTQFIPTYSPFQNCTVPNQMIPFRPSVITRPPPGLYTNPFPLFPEFSTPIRIQEPVQLPSTINRNDYHNLSKTCQNVNFQNSNKYQNCGCDSCTKISNLEQVNCKNKFNRTEPASFEKKLIRCKENLDAKPSRDSQNEMIIEDEKIREKLGVENEMKRIFDDELISVESANSITKNNFSPIRHKETEVKLFDRSILSGMNRKNNSSPKNNCLPLLCTPTTNENASIKLFNSNNVTQILHETPSILSTTFVSQDESINGDENNVCKSGKNSVDHTLNSNYSSTTQEDDSKTECILSRSKKAANRTSLKLNPIKQFVLQHKNKKKNSLDNL